MSFYKNILTGLMLLSVNLTLAINVSAASNCDQRNSIINKQIFNLTNFTKNIDTNLKNLTSSAQEKIHIATRFNLDQDLVKKLQDDIPIMQNLENTQADFYKTQANYLQKIVGLSCTDAQRKSLALELQTWYNSNKENSSKLSQFFTEKWIPDNKALSALIIEYNQSVNKMKK